MALQSYLTGVRDQVKTLMFPYTRTDGEIDEYIRLVLSNEMARFVAGDYAKPKVLEWSFRAIDAERFAVVTNAVLDNDWKKVDAGIDSILETCLEDFSGGQLAILRASHDSSLDGATLSYDIKPDGSADDAVGGSWLAETQGVSLPWDANVFIDPYPTDHFGLRLKLTGGSLMSEVRAVRLSLLFVGERDYLSRDGDAIANFAAAREMDRRERIAMSEHQRDSVITGLQNMARKLRAHAMGLLGVADGQTKLVSGGHSAGGPVDAGLPIMNRSWERFKNRL